MKTLTSPPEGFKVPTNATSIRGQKLSSDATPRPVKAINAQAASSNGRWWKREAWTPMSSVRIPEPSKVVVAMRPT